MPAERVAHFGNRTRGTRRAIENDLRGTLRAKSRATLTPPLKSPSALISLRKIGIGKSSFASNRDPTQEVDSHK